MGNIIKISRGLKSKMPTLADGQQYLCTDTGEIWVGNNGNKNTAESAGAGQISATYAELVALIKSRSLKPGAQYILTDYKTTYQQPVTNVIKTANSSAERLVLTATTPNTFDPQVTSIDYPQDIIWYDFNNNKCEDKTTPRNGFIMRRHDVKTNINIPHDWRTMEWARFLVDITGIPVWKAGMKVTAGKYYIVGNTICRATNTGTPINQLDPKFLSCIVIYNYPNNYIMANDMPGLKANKTKMDEFKTIPPDRATDIYIGDCTNDTQLHNNVIKYPSGSYIVKSIHLGMDCYNNTFAEHASTYSSHVIFDGYSGDNIITGAGWMHAGFGFFGNILKSVVYCTFGTNCQYNTLHDARDTRMEDGCKYNAFGESINAIILGSRCEYNYFSNLNNRISIGSGSNNNSFGQGCSDISLGSNCSYNSFGEFHNKISVGINGMTSKNISAISEFANNIVSIEVKTNTGNKSVYIKIDENNQPIYTVLP